MSENRMHLIPNNLGNEVWEMGDGYTVTKRGIYNALQLSIAKNGPTYVA